MRRFAVLLAVCCLVPISFASNGADRSEEVTWLGVQLGSAGNGTIEGVPVLRVIEDSPAHKGGLRARDLIVAVDGEAVGNNSGLIQRIQSLDTGSWVSLQVMRGDDERDVRVRLITRPELEKMRPRTGWLGVQAIGLPPTLREHFGSPKQAGVMISQIAEASPAESAGFELGDVVFEMDGMPISSPGQLAKRLAGAGVGNRVEFLLTRWGQELELNAIIDVAPDRGSRR